jgi:hypothetical protein
MLVSLLTDGTERAAFSFLQMKEKDTKEHIINVIDTI